MKFVFFDRHNNNKYPLHAFKGADASCYLRSDGYITDSGITFFMPPSSTEMAERALIIRALHASLKQHFTQGLAAVVCAESDCADRREFVALFQEVKLIDPQIKTIEIINTHPENRLNKSLGADHCINNFDLNKDVQTALIEAVGPNSADQAVPPQGWEAYKRRLNELYRAAVNNEGSTCEKSPQSFWARMARFLQHRTIV